MTKHVFIELEGNSFSPTTVGWHIYPDSSWVELIVRKGYASALSQLYRRLGLDATHQCVVKAPDLDSARNADSNRRRGNEAHY